MTINVGIARPQAWLLASDSRTSNALRFWNSPKIFPLTGACVAMVRGLANFIRASDLNIIRDKDVLEAVQKGLQGAKSLVTPTQVVRAVRPHIRDLVACDEIESMLLKLRLHAATWSFVGFDSKKAPSLIELELPNNRIAHCERACPGEFYFFEGSGRAVLRDFLRVIENKRTRTKFENIISRNIRDKERKGKFLKLMERAGSFRGLAFLKNLDIEEQRRLLKVFLDLLIFYDHHAESFKNEYTRRGTIGGPVKTAIVTPEGSTLFV